ncbi:MAG TPA: HEAT repeat domain-containing protein [Planctomycetota bacterium]|nr:HEAT repeat domain-containing protein [Planctomycetota bacterium]
MAGIPDLQAQLKSSDDRERWLAAWHLAQAGKEAAPALVEALKHADAVVRYWAAVGLGNAGDETAVEPLRAALKDDSGDARVAAAEALVRLGAQQEGVQGLVAAFEHTSEWVRLRALRAVERLGPAAAEAVAAARKAAQADKGYPGRMAEHFAGTSEEAPARKEPRKERRGNP